MRLNAHVTMSNAETVILAVAVRVPCILEKQGGHRMEAGVVRIEEAVGRGHAHSDLLPDPDTSHPPDGRG